MTVGEKGNNGLWVSNNERIGSKYSKDYRYYSNDSFHSFFVDNYRSIGI